MSDRFVLLTGCSGGGKSTLLQALGARGFATVDEPGRRIVAEELRGYGHALPWVDMTAFARRALEVAKADLEAAQAKTGAVFFDRGLIDAAVALAASGGPPISQTIGASRHYAQQVIVVPPWRELFSNDRERRHDFEAAVDEYNRIANVLSDLGYETIELPRVSVRARADLVIERSGAV